MQTITIYDIEEEKINEMCDEHDTTEAEIIEAILEAIKDNHININDYL